MARLGSGHDVLPFLARWHAVSNMALQPLPAEMEQILRASPDYREITGGDRPVWVTLSAGEEGGELILYRALTTNLVYVVSPVSSQS